MCVTLWRASCAEPSLEGHKLCLPVAVCGGNYQTSIVDLLKLVDLDSSLDARKQLANELGVHAGADGSAAENTALHKAVMAKLAENGRTVPQSMRG